MYYKQILKTLLDILLIFFCINFDKNSTEKVFKFCDKKNRKGIYLFFMLKYVFLVRSEKETTQKISLL